MKKLLMPLVAGGLLIGTIAGSQAATFAQFLQQTGAQNFTFSGGNAGTLSTTADPVFFQFKSGSGFTILPGLLDQNINAVLTFSATANGSPAINAGGSPTQQFLNTNFTFTSVGTQTIGGVTIAPGTVLLSATNNAVVPPIAATLSGGAQSSTFSAPVGTFPNNIVYSSAFINFAGTTNPGFAYSLTPGLTTSGAGPTLAINPFTAAGTGTFTATAAPAAVPEPGSLAFVAGIGVCGSALAFRRRARRAARN
jgi:hypothetical protein